ncbi:isoprenylcysteine carboxylmethyltransferase family protein [Phenylobacterium sp.]|uniref:methyltransferase family protein n=1 Tax=Phenylobacterium sp. TaxID=1871053 RepID=UPI002DEFE2A9|nr:isoprenylcysteine carboxylmethyltransferase family protein [Phenylobacterium sp.]
MRIFKALVAPLPPIIVVAAVLLLTAGLAGRAWVWLHAWVFLAVVAGLSMTGSAILAAARPASFAVRQQGLVATKAKKQPLIDVLGVFLYLAFILAWFAFVALDAARLRLLPAPGPAIAAGGLAAVVVGVAVAHVAIGQNPFAAPTIHDQSEGGQRVIDTGLYGVVRHPFYAGMLLFYVGAALWLGSYAAAIGAVGFLIMTLARIVIEERYLRANLPGYGDYARRVTGRLIPYVL